MSASFKNEDTPVLLGMPMLLMDRIATGTSTSTTTIPFGTQELGLLVTPVTQFSFL